MAIGIAAGRHDHEIYARNGGSLFLAMPIQQQQRHAAGFEALTYAIEVGTGAGAVGIIHADAPCPWPKINHVLFDPKLSAGKLRTIDNRVLWSRQRVEQADNTTVAGMAQVVPGHSPVPRLRSLGNVFHLDTGAVFGGTLTALNIEIMITTSVSATAYASGRTA